MLPRSACAAAWSPTASRAGSSFAWRVIRRSPPAMAACRSGDADALLLRGLADVAVAVADEPPVALAQALLQLRLPADPAPDEDRQAHRDEGERRVGRALDARIEERRAPP